MFKLHTAKYVYTIKPPWFLFVFHQVKIWFQNRRMKWKRSRKAKDQATPLTDTERTEIDTHSAKPQSDSHSSSLEDEEELEGEEEDDNEKEEIETLRAGSLAPVGFMRNGTGSYSSYSDKELDEEGPRTRSGVFPYV